MGTEGEGRAIRTIQKRAGAYKPKLGLSSILHKISTKTCGNLGATSQEIIELVLWRRVDCGPELAPKLESSEQEITPELAPEPELGAANHRTD